MRVISTKCDYRNKGIRMHLQIVNAGIAIGQVLEMLADNKQKSHPNLSG